jgi:hypothetical protein
MKAAAAIVLFILLFVLLFSIGNNTLEKDELFPRWLKNDSYRTDQTSGIAFVNLNDEKFFLLADDTGEIHKLKIVDDTVFNFTKYQFTAGAEAFIKTLPKADFEEIIFDKHTGKVYLSIEGNGANYKEHAGIYEVIFKNDNISSGVIEELNKLNITPAAQFEKYLAPNIGYEGAAVDENYFYFGLEGFRSGNFFADSTILFIVDKKTLKILKEISTKEFEIHTICALVTKGNNLLWGVDRNKQEIFFASLDNYLNLKVIKKYNLIPSIPGYENISYIAAIEAAAFDDENNLYLVDDPWKSFYIPGEEIQKKLDSQTIENFKSFIPIIYKYNLN